MRILLTTQPGHGHFDPIVPYAVALRAAGHEVRVASSQAFAPAVEAAGFEHTPIGPDFTWARAEEKYPEIVYFAPRGEELSHAAEISWTDWNPAAARDLLASFETWRPDLLIREFGENGATFAGQVAGIPVLCASWSALPTDGRRWGTVLDWSRMLEHYRTVAGTFGLSLTDAEQVWNGQPVLTGLPPAWFAGTVPGMPVRHFRLPLADAPAGGAPEWLDALGRERPLVYATLGTVYNRQREVRQALIDGLGGLDADVLLTTGQNVGPEEVGPVPGNLRVESFLPQSFAMARASLVVSHAGLGTMLGAIYHGVPMVPIVLGVEHPINAASAEAAGLALPLDRAEADAERIAATAKQALQDPVLRAKSDAVRRECEALEPVEGVVSLVESYA